MYKFKLSRSSFSLVRADAACAYVSLLAAYFPTESTASLLNMHEISIIIVIIVITRRGTRITGE
jgi:hypothetical protein